MASDSLGRYPRCRVHATNESERLEVILRTDECPALFALGHAPGFERLQVLLATAEKAAFVPEGFLRWFNRVRSAGELALTTAPLTIEGVADEIAEAFRQRVQWWGA